MKRSIFSILAGATFIFIIGSVLFPPFLGQTVDSVLDSTVTTVIIFIGGVISGYISMKKGYLHGLFAGLLNYLITLLFFLIFGLYLKFVIQAQWTEGSSSDVITELFNYFKGIVFSGLVGSLGGFIGEKFRK